jgi:hypothetical protein
MKNAYIHKFFKLGSTFHAYKDETEVMSYTHASIELSDWKHWITPHGEKLVLHDSRTEDAQYLYWCRATHLMTGVSATSRKATLTVDGERNDARILPEFIQPTSYTGRLIMQQQTHICNGTFTMLTSDNEYLKKAVGYTIN